MTIMAELLSMDDIGGFGPYGPGSPRAFLLQTNTFVSYARKCRTTWTTRTKVYSRV